MPLTVAEVSGETKMARETLRNEAMQSNLSTLHSLPGWLPDAVRLYLHHTENGISLRALARRDGKHASTVMRLVRRYEGRRDDPLVDEELSALCLFYTSRCV